MVQVIVRLAWIAVMTIIVCACSQKTMPCAKVEFRIGENTSADGLTPTFLPKKNKTIYLHAESVISGADIIEVEANEWFSEGGEWMDEESFRAFYGPDRAIPKETRNDVRLKLSKRAAERMENVSEENELKAIAILVDGKLIMAPTIHGKISDEIVLSDDGMTKTEANNIARALQSGMHCF